MIRKDKSLEEVPTVPSRVRRVTFRLHQDVLAELDEAVARGAAPSKNALVERAIVRELRELRQQARRAQWEEAARDPLFLKDIQEIETDFRWADAETARRIG